MIRILLNTVGHPSKRRRGKNMDVLSKPNWNNADSTSVLKHISDFCARTLQLEITASPSEGRFVSRKPAPGRLGILEVTGELQDSGKLDITVLLARWPSHLSVPVSDIWDRLAGMNNRIRLLPAQTEGDHHVLLKAVLPVQAAIMGFARAAALQEELLKINEFAAVLQKQIPVPLNEPSLLNAYQPVSALLEPVLSTTMDFSGLSSELRNCFQDIADFLGAGITVALALPHEMEQSFALAGIARALMNRGNSLGWPKPSVIQTRAIMEISEKAPEIAVMPALRLNLASNPYEIGHEMKALLAAINRNGKPVLFCGTYSELQSILHGGQGAANDPLQPAVITLPPVELNLLIAFTVARVAGKNGAVARPVLQDMESRIITVLETVPLLYKGMVHRVMETVQTRLTLHDLYLRGAQPTVEIYHLFICSEQSLWFESLDEILQAVILFGDVMSSFATERYPSCHSCHPE